MVPTHTMLNEALRWLARGIGCVPVQPGTKKLLKGTQPKKLEVPTEKDYTMWFGKGQNNIAVVPRFTNGLHLTILDFDSIVAYYRWRLEHQIDTYTVRSTRGFHAYFWLKEMPFNGVLPKKTEVKFNGQPILCPPSVVSGYQYSVKSSTGITTAKNLSSIVRVERKLERPIVNVPLFSPTLKNNPYQQARAKIPLTVLLENYGPIRSGDRFWMSRCPVHRDRSRSLSIDTVNGLCSCFKPGCKLHSSKGFDVVGVYAAMNGVSNKQALKELL